MAKLQLKSYEQNIHNENFEKVETPASTTVNNTYRTTALLLDSKLQQDLDTLANLVSNVSESYSSIIFLANNQRKTLQPAAIHSLSRDIQATVKIPFGNGLIGWTAENGVRISVCPFENDACTLLYYDKDQALKSFIALPIFDQEKNFLGVLSCDSKKSYAFSKTTEKILNDCCTQIASILSLHSKAAKTKVAFAPSEDPIKNYTELLQSQRTEQALLNKVAEIPHHLIDRDALVVITVDEPNYPSSAFHSSSNQTGIASGLMELVSRHKKLICKERSVHAPTLDANHGRSFLSVPFCVFNREVGSLNVLSKLGNAFSDQQIAMLEKISLVIGKELELIRLRDKNVSPETSTGLLPWETFSHFFKAAIKERAAQKDNLVLIRLAITNTYEIEDLLGVDGARQLIFQLMRLIVQVKGSYAIAGHLFGNHILLLATREEAPKLMGRFYRLLEVSPIEKLISINLKSATSSILQSRTKLNNLLARGLAQVVVQCPQHGETVEELMAKSNRLIEEVKSGITGS